MDRNRDYLRGWTTNNEVAFIDGLISGKYLEGKVLNKTPIDLLTGYIRHAKNRKRWDTFADNSDPDEIIKYAQGLLDKLNG